MEIVGHGIRNHGRCANDPFPPGCFAPGANGCHPSGMEKTERLWDDEANDPGGVAAISRGSSVANTPGNPVRVMPA
jgi:hypothetical protein